MPARIVVVPALVLALACCAALAAPALADAEVLKRGSRGPVVVQLQQKLGISADGVFGPQTARAVKSYQARKGLVVDGVVGPQTADALGISLAEVRSASGGRKVRIPAMLERIAQCESGGDPGAISSGGTYRGKYQFDRQTWQAMGGSGDPARASEAEQDRRALALLRARGTSPWPSCAG
ncbi:MAG TPA: transglycosylase family protein [Conexibacter sp.]|nr:transglycosylase family protein [Conexibacter sp.]